MAQISRPFQIALAGVVVLALAWFVVLRGHGSSSSEPASTPSASAPAKSAAGTSSQSAAASGKAQERAAAAPTRVYHGAAPGVEGLTRDIAKAHGAVATSQQNAAELERRSAQASGEAPAAGGAGRSAPTASHAGGAAQTMSSAKGTRVVRSGGISNGPQRPAQQVQVERELTHGKTVVLVFWDPKSTVDQNVRSQALALVGGSKGKLAVHFARPSQVGLFGTVTEVAHVYQTPTIVIVNKHGIVSTLSGLTDVFGLQQAVREAERS